MVCLNLRHLLTYKLKILRLRFGLTPLLYHVPLWYSQPVTVLHPHVQGPLLLQFPDCPSHNFSKDRDHPRPS